MNMSKPKTLSINVGIVTAILVVFYVYSGTSSEHSGSPHMNLAHEMCQDHGHLGPHACCSTISQACPSSSASAALSSESVIGVPVCYLCYQCFERQGPTSNSALVLLPQHRQPTRVPLFQTARRPVQSAPGHTLTECDDLRVPTTGSIALAMNSAFLL